MATTKAVVDPVKMPKVKANNNLIAGINAASLSLSTFMGWMAIFAGIAGFTTKGWAIEVPFASLFFGANNTVMGIGQVAFAAGIASVLLAVVGLITAGKITDIEAMKKSWKWARNAIIACAAIEVVKMVSIAIFALCGIGSKAFSEGYVWLNSFLSCTLAALALVGLAFIAHFISVGKTTVLSVMRFVAIGIASVGCALLIISTIVGNHRTVSLGGSSSSSSSSSSSTSVDDILNWFK